MHKTLQLTFATHQGENTMQVARYWRMKKQNYRLEGVRYTNGAVSLQPRPAEEVATIKETDAQKVRA
jgi:hypothetical protein